MVVHEKERCAKERNSSDFGKIIYCEEEKMKKQSKLLISAALLGLTGMVSVSAADVYELNPVVVTAQRIEKTEINTPVTETIVTTKKIEEAGYKNAFDIIEHQVGLSSTGYGDAGQDFGFSAGRTVVRGYDRGTLVMVDGIPLNLKNYNSLDGIPVDMIEKVEIIKGASGTLYGAEAMGGVINIITKRPEGMKPVFKVKGTVGNYYKDYGVNYSDDRFIIGLQKEYSNKNDNANDYPGWSIYDWRTGRGQKNRATVVAKVTDEVTANLMYQDGHVTRWAENKKNKNNYIHKDRRMTAGLHYAGKDNGVEATVGYNNRKVYGDDFAKNTIISSAANLQSYIGDIQKTWDLGEDTLILGYTFKRESYKGLSQNGVKGHRTNNALYMSYDHVFTDKFSATLGLRGEFIDDVLEDQRVFNPQIQTLYKINDTTSWYINVGKAFQMPTVDAQLGKKKGAKDLKPEKGWTYETGIKKMIGNDSSLKIAVYHMDFENKFGWSDKDSNGNQDPINKGDFRNTGIEAEYEKRVNTHWNYSLGLGFSNPEIRDPSVKNAKWEQDSARIDGVASVTYRTDKLRSTLSYKYLGDREDYKTKKKNFGDVPSRSRFTWNTIYDVTDNDTVTLTLNNLFDHKNYANRWGNLELPFNWRLSYSHKF